MQFFQRHNYIPVSTYKYIYHDEWVLLPYTCTIVAFGRVSVDSVDVAWSYIMLTMVEISNMM